MSKKIEKNIIAGLDIGTSKVVALIGEVHDDRTIELIGIGVHPSTGLKKGVVVDIEATIKSIQRATEAAELMAGCDIHAVYTGIAGAHIRSLNSHGIVAIKEREVSALDIDGVINAAKAVAIPADQKILHILPQQFIIDNQEGIRQPIGMAGVRLEAKVHMVTGSVSSAQNIVKCVRRCGLEVADIILEQLASSYAVLSEDEKELGICLVDIGGGTTDIAIFHNGAIRHTAVIPIAGNQVTNDIAVALRTPSQAAEELKVKYGSVSNRISEGNDTINIPGITEQFDRQVSRRALADVIEPRYEELFSLIHGELRRSGFEDFISAGIVFTGGASKITGGLELAERIFRVPVRLGVPKYVTGLSEVIHNPIYSTSVGLLLYGLQHQHSQYYKQPGRRRLPQISIGNRPNFKGLFTRMQNWFQAQF